MSRAWDKEKIWVPYRTNLGPPKHRAGALSTELQTTLGERGHIVGSYLARVLHTVWISNVEIVMYAERYVTCWLFHLHNNRSNQQKSNFALAANLFLYISFPLFCTTTTWNFQKLPSCAFYGENVVRVLVHLFFSLLLILTLVAASISHFLTVAIKFSCYSSNKKCLVCFFISRSLRWPVSYFLVFSVFLFLYILNLWTWQLI